MKLHNNQLYLIRHLVRFNYLDHENCLDVLDREDKTGIPVFDKAFVMIEITTPRGTHNRHKEE